MMGRLLVTFQQVSIPLTAWESAGIVALFVVAFLAFVAAVRYILNDQRKSQLASQQALLQQQQDFIETQNKQWQGFLVDQRAADHEQREQDRKQMAELAKFIQLLASEVNDLTKDFRDHTVEEMARFDVLLNPEQKRQVDAKRDATKAENEISRPRRGGAR